MCAIPIPEPIERAVNNRGESFIHVLGAQQMGRHHWRQRQRDHARDENGAGERERKFAEERSGQPALQRDRRVDRRQRDCHRDDWAYQFARAFQRSIHARHAFANVTFDIFDDDDRVIDDQPDRQHNREERQQVQREAKGLH